MRTSAATSPAPRILEESGLASAHDPIDVPVVGRLLEKHFEIGGVLERIATEKDDTFRLRGDSGDYLVKVSPVAEPEMVVALQTAAMRFLERTAAQLPIQRVILDRDGADHVRISTSDGRVRILRVFGFVEGVVLARTRPDAAQLAELGTTLGRIDVALRTFDHPAARRRLAWDIGRFGELTGLTEYVASKERRQLAAEVVRLFDRVIAPRLDDLATQVIHGDYSPHNIVVDPHAQNYVTGVIDFGDTLRSAVIFDPAVCMANLLGRSPNEPWREACAFATGYGRARPVMATELQLLPVAALTRLTLRALIANWRAQRVPERRDYLLAHAKEDWINLRRAIAVPLDDVIAMLA